MGASHCFVASLQEGPKSKGRRVSGRRGEDDEEEDELSLSRPRSHERRTLGESVPDSASLPSACLYRIHPPPPLFVYRHFYVFTFFFFFFFLFLFFFWRFFFKKKNELLQLESVSMGPD